MLMQPGETVTPGNAPAAQPQPPTAQPSVVQPPAPSASPPAPAATVSSDGNAISWTASEYLIHHKSSGWYIALGGITAALAILIWLVTEDIVSVVVVSIVGLVFGIGASRQPRVLDYRVDEQGLHMGNKTYAYEEFKSFSVLVEESLSSILLIPLKRFMPGVSIYYPPEQELAIAQVLGLYLPHEERKPDMVDRLMHKVRY